MFHAVLLKMRQRVCAGRMALTILMLASPAREETYHDDWLTEDLENGILQGAIVERQWDETWQEWKDVVAGDALDGRSMAIVAKLGRH